MPTPRTLLFALTTLAALASGCSTDAAPDDQPTAGDEDDLKPARPLGPEPKGQAAALPIVLAHGFDASPTNRWGFYNVADALRKDGHRVHVAMVPPYNSAEDRAKKLLEHVEQALAETGASQVNLVAHSMGGLDARIVAHQRPDLVASVTTISSPHRGAPVADVALGLLPGALDDAIDALASAWGLTYNDLAGDSSVRAAMTSLSTKRAAAFNAEITDSPGVYYQSYAGVSSVGGIAGPHDDEACEGMRYGDWVKSDRMNATLVPMAAFTAHGLSLTPNDGMAAVESAKWGSFRGCIPADHLDEVGQEKHTGADKRTGFDHIRFYRNLAFELSSWGF